MSDDKDRLGEQLRNKEKAEEDRYFAEVSKKQLEKLRERHAQAAKSGHGQCPRCGNPLQVTDQRGVAVDACPKGCGLWLDKGELDLIASREGDSWLSRLLVGSRG
jgi:DNA repair exonuclease SbcCD ATPase subunit